MAMVAQRTITLGDEVWIASALLHREHPDRSDFTVREIADQVRAEAAPGTVRPGILPHIYLHCVANYPPNPGRLCLLFATGKNTRRLFRPGDSRHPQRTGGKTMPSREKLPERYRALLDWYLSQYVTQHQPDAEHDPILRLRGLGKEIWDEHPDHYVRRLREGWE